MCDQYAEHSQHHMSRVPRHHSIIVLSSLEHTAVLESLFLLKEQSISILRIGECGKHRIVVFVCRLRVLPGI